MELTKEVVVVSGKGGTGKTSLSGALASLLENGVIADCDVDAANLHLILDPGEPIRSTVFMGGKKAKIDPGSCTRCGICRGACRFGAISEDLAIDPILCEGCGACHALCPAGAVGFSSHLAGYCYVNKLGGRGRFVCAELFPGEENSGKLVAMVREEARREAQEAGYRLILIDGPPGIGCPVISSLTGADLAIAVTEPTPSGVHDLKRLVGLARHFRIPTAVVVNKSDINLSFVEEMKSYCDWQDLIYLGDIPYDPGITEAQREAKTIVEFNPRCNASEAIQKIYARLKSVLEDL